MVSGGLVVAFWRALAQWTEPPKQQWIDGAPAVVISEHAHIRPTSPSRNHGCRSHGPKAEHWSCVNQYRKLTHLFRL